nr:hypothetical protein [Tanacetum cinerariifolium]
MWIMDSGASRHISNNKGILRQQEFLVKEIKVLLKFTSGKSLALNNVLYVPSVCRNMVFESLLLRVGLKIVLEGDKVVITRNNNFVGKGGFCDGEDGDKAGELIALRESGVEALCDREGEGEKRRLERDVLQQLPFPKK